MNIKIIPLILLLILTGCNVKSDKFDICSGKPVHITINNSILNSSVACTQEEQNKGLMFIKKLEDNSGMIFVFEKDRPLSFWMKNTEIPLSIAFVNKELTIVDIKEMNALDETPVNASSPAMYAIEANKNWFLNQKINIGDKIKIE